MKSLETQLAELKEFIIPAEVKAGFSEASAQTGWKDAMSGKSVEEQLSIAKEKAKKLGISESGKKISRNNGKGGSETIHEDYSNFDGKDLTERVATFSRRYGVSKAEAILSLEGNRESFNPYTTERELREAWKPYDSILTPVEIDTLVRGKVQAPKNK